MDILVNLSRIRVKPAEMEGVFLSTQIPFGSSYTESSCKETPDLKLGFQQLVCMNIEQHNSVTNNRVHH